MKLFSYIVKHDAGFAPNPFWGYCTLANCKPRIRKTAQAGDWIVGLSPKAQGNKIVYAMQVEEILPFAAYYRDPRFACKKPSYEKGRMVMKRGDNIYEPLAHGEFYQHRSGHSNGDKENPDSKKHDLGGKNVLLSRNYYYFGSKAIELPSEFFEIRVGRAHKCRFSDDLIRRFINFISRYPKGLQAHPALWLEGDNSWRLGMV